MVRAPERNLDDLPRQLACPVVHDVVRANQDLHAGSRLDAVALVHAVDAERRTQPRAVDRRGFDQLSFTDELRDEPGGGQAIYGTGIVPLVGATGIHDAEPVGEGKGFVLIVGDQDRAHVLVPEDPSHLADDRQPELGVEAGKRFVHQEQFRARRHRPGERYPLLFSARHRMRHAPFVARQSEDRQQLADPAGAFRGHSLAQPESDVARDIEMGKQGEVLKHHADLSMPGLHHGLRRRQHTAIQGHAAVHRPLQPGYAPKQGRLSAAAWPHEASRLAMIQRDRGIRHRDTAAVSQRQVRQVQHRRAMRKGIARPGGCR